MPKSPFGKPAEQEAPTGADSQPQGKQPQDQAVGDPVTENPTQDGADSTPTSADNAQGGENQSLDKPLQTQEQAAGNPVGEIKPPEKSDNASQKPSGAKKRVKNETLKGKKIIVGEETIQADENGVIEVDEVQAVRLLSIPGYKEA
jgi:hypothetical protein